ncbi:MAG TPA: Uma2 family endonuclease [Thermoanaerobaculia bacterium]
MVKLLHPPATYADLLKVPEHLVAELVDGVLIAAPRPASRHARAAGALHHIIGGSFDYDDTPGGWWIVFEPELHFGHDVLVPDLAGWRRARMPVFPDVRAFHLAPDWICEVVSPSTSRLDRANKLPIYARNDIPHVWLVDPIAKTVEILRLANGRWSTVATHCDDDTISAAPFDAVDLKLASLWID